MLRVAVALSNHPVLNAINLNCRPDGTQTIYWGALSYLKYRP